MVFSSPFIHHVSQLSLKLSDYCLQSGKNTHSETLYRVYPIQKASAWVVFVDCRWYIDIFGFWRFPYFARVCVLFDNGVEFLCSSRRCGQGHMMCLHRPKEAPVAALEHGRRILEMRCFWSMKLWSYFWALIQSSMKPAADTVSRKLVHARSVCPVARFWCFQLKRFIGLKFKVYWICYFYIIHNTTHPSGSACAAASCRLGGISQDLSTLLCSATAFEANPNSNPGARTSRAVQNSFAWGADNFYNWGVGDGFGRLEVMNLSCCRCQQGCTIHGITFGESKHPLVAYNCLWNAL